MRALTKSEFVDKATKHIEKNKQIVKNEGDLYMWDKARRCGAKDARHKGRQPYYRSK
ncbi:MAG: hypothetical protein RR891_06215 [Clostridium sp.]